MIRALRFARGFAVSALGTAAIAQSFNYPDFSSIAGLSLNGTAAASGTALRVTGSGSAQTGSIWSTAPVSVAEGFETTFDFLMTASPEGLAFVVHGAPTGALTLGGGSWGIGYGFGVNTAPIPNCLAIEMDATQDGWLNDTSANELSIHTVGALGNSENEGVSIGRVTPAVDLTSNSVRKMRVRYVPGVSGQPGTLTVFVDNLVTPLLTTPFRFETGGTQLTGGSTGGLGLINGQAWVGFTSATRSGSSAQYAEIRSWTWTSFQLPDACYTGNVRLGAGGPFDLLTINGNAGGFFRTAQLAVADPFTVAIVPPPGLTTAPYGLFATIGVAGGPTITPTPWGLACFAPTLLVDIGSPLAPHTLALPPGFVLTVPLTFQAAMATDPGNPAVIELTNAIVAQFTFAPAPAITTVTPASAAPGATITVNGSNFSLFATVDVGGTPVVPLTVTKTAITFPMPAVVPCGTVVRVSNPDGAQATANFNPNPTITSQVNTSGPAAGGTTYVIVGTGFAAGTTATIGGVPANVTSASATVVVISTPPNSVGPKTVVVRTPGGCTVNSTFTYL